MPSTASNGRTMKVFTMSEDDSDEGKSSGEARTPRGGASTIHEVDEDMDSGEPVEFTCSRLGPCIPDTPLLMPSRSLVRVSTYASSLNQPATSRHGSTRLSKMDGPKSNGSADINRDSQEIAFFSYDITPEIDDPNPSKDEENQLLGITTSPRPPAPPSLIHSPSATSICTRSRSRYRNSIRKVRKRAVLKNGECNVLQAHIRHRRLHYLQDIFTTLVDVQWRWTLLVFALSFILSWLIFAVIWWLIAFTHSDLDEDHLPHNQQVSGWTPCVVNIFSFTSCFLFSIETQHTIGYGSRSTTEECPEAIFVMCLQSITGVMIQAFMVGIVFAKLARPKQRTQTLLFSRHAVVCQRDGDLCLMVRVGDMRKSHIIGATVRAQMIRSKTTKEGEILNTYQSELQVGTEGGNENLFFIWPTTVVHRIDKDSPLYTISANDIIGRDAKFEIVVILEGTIESTGQTTQARTSYLPNEILWGHRFESMVEYNKERQGYEVNYSKFNNTQLVDTPLCSAKELEDFYRIQDDARLTTDSQGAMSLQSGLRRVTSAPYKMNNALAQAEEDSALLSLSIGR